MENKVAKTSYRCPHSLPGRGRWFFKWSEARGRLVGSGQRGGLGGLPTHLGGPVCRDHVWYSAFALGTSEAAVSFWPFYIFLFIIALNVCDWSYFYSFFLFCYLRRHLSRSKCKHSNRGSQVVPAILTSSGAWELTCTSFQNPVCTLFPIPPAVASH